MKNHNTRQRVGILVTENAPLFELSCAIEVFALPALENANWYDTKVISLETGQVTSTTGLQFNVEQVDSLSDFDTLVIPGWQVGRRNIKLKMAQAIHDFAERGGRIVSFCSGAFLLGYLGLLKGKRTTTHWRYADALSRQFPEAEYIGDVLFTEDGNIHCSAGSAAALDLCVEIVRQDWGASVANQVARRLVISAHRQGGQSQFIDRPVDSKLKSNGMSQLLDWAMERIASPMDVDTLAAKANMSRRSFDRHFRAQTGISPKAWLNQQRIMVARELLEQGDKSVEQVAQSVGFDNAITLRFNFKKLLGISPTAYQQQFLRMG